MGKKKKVVLIYHKWLIISTLSTEILLIMGHENLYPNLVRSSDKKENLGLWFGIGLLSNMDGATA